MSRASKRSNGEEPGPSTSRQARTSQPKRACRAQSFLDHLDESDFSASEDEEWTPGSSGRLAGSGTTSDLEGDSDEDSEEELQGSSVSTSSSDPRRLYYLRNLGFIDRAPQNVAEHLEPGDQLKPIEYFFGYVSNDFVETIVQYTNMRSTELTGVSINTNATEMLKFIGMNFAMSIVKMPRIRMYWQTKTRIPWIADKMPRDRFFKLRSNLKVVDDNRVQEEERKRDRLWKVRPLLEEIRHRCNELPKPAKVSIDESMIPFRGHVSVRQHVPGKPFPDGLKMFVLASPSGMVLDFEIYQTKDSLMSVIDQLGVKPDRNTITVGEAAVLRFVRSVENGTSIFFDRYFTSANLLCDLYERGLRGTGTIKKNMVPKEAKAKLKSEPTLRKQGRGASDCLVRNDGKVAITAWYDKKLVLMGSNEFSVNDEDECQRWCKAERTHVPVKRPRVVREYNDAMGGVDLHDQVLSYYRSFNRSKKWTVRVVLHMLDLVSANCWMEYRNDAGPHPHQYMDFKLILADQLMSDDLNISSTSDSTPRTGVSTESETEPSPKQEVIKIAIASSVTFDLEKNFEDLRPLHNVVRVCNTVLETLPPLVSTWVSMGNSNHTLTK
ncbi:hypothetical protein Pmani_008650 [Petrolisthes manimaculis]|uniref:PiggyBac transposable element-derived protein domain-containing protein n=1 Tax=Petrolisthes manimaculis TaxID=1843537 RepID=A0AAE1Q513_9EUCA|nr:hypothetical protein Pmani_008650 [Petrolisthes manimaculis]